MLDRKVTITRGIMRSFKVVFTFNTRSYDTDPKSFPAKRQNPNVPMLNTSFARLPHYARFIARLFALT